jgi:hypothetical protein
MELPKSIIYDLEGYRGFNKVEFPLVIERKFGRYLAHYSHDEAECSLACQWGDTEEEAMEKLYKEARLYHLI